MTLELLPKSFGTGSVVPGLETPGGEPALTLGVESLSTLNKGDNGRFF